MTDITLRLTVNRKPRTVTVPVRTTLADLLRDYLDLTGTHLGCEQGVCGACTVLLDELPVRACLTLAAACEGCEVLTVEGFDGPDAERLRARFSQEGALQCGFCTSGMLLSAYDLVRGRQPLSRDEICLAMSGNICRCTGYNGIVRAVGAAIDEGIEAETADAAPTPRP
jgi:aerobic carbon-monoxide dehydrogenase small subunit